MEKKINYRPTKLACYIGYVTQAIVINLAPLFFVIFSDKYGIDNAKLGTLVLVNFLVQILTDLSAVKLTAKVSIRALAIWAHILSFAGLTLLGILPAIMPNTFAALLTASVIYSVGGGLIEVVISPIVDAIPVEESESEGGAKAAAMSFLHSFYCWGQMSVVLITTLILSLVGNDNWWYIPFIWAIIPFVNIFGFIRSPFPKFISEQERTPIRKIVSSRLFIVCALLMICSGASELAVSQWASMLAEKGLGVNKVTGDLLGPCAFAFFMGIGRMIYGTLGTKLPLARALFLCSTLCIGGYLMITLFQNAVIALLGCSVCGFAVSLMWPGVLSLTAREFSQGGAVLFSLLAICGDIGCSLGPWLTGFVSEHLHADAFSKLAPFAGFETEQISLKCGLFAAGIFPVIMLVAVVVFMAIRGKKEKNT